MPPTNPSASEQDRNHFNTLAPSAPVNLLRAGVPPSEVVWLRGLDPDRQVAALGTARGKLLLDQVRSFMAGGQRHPR